jgi:hypothetical protein
MSILTETDLFRGGSATLVASWEEYTEGATGASVERASDVDISVWVHESDTAMHQDRSRRGYAFDGSTRAMATTPQKRR